MPMHEITLNRDNGKTEKQGDRKVQVQRKHPKKKHRRHKLLRIGPVAHSQNQRHIQQVLKIAAHIVSIEAAPKTKADKTKVADKSK